MGKISDATPITELAGTEQIPIADPAQPTSEINLSTGLTALFSSAEFTSAGVLVFPGHEPLTPTYNANSTIDTFTVSYQGKTWTIKYNYDLNGNVASMNADDGSGGNSWTRTYTYNADNTLATDSGWI